MSAKGPSETLMFDIREYSIKSLYRNKHIMNCLLTQLVASFMEILNVSNKNNKILKNI